MASSQSRDREGAGGSVSGETASLSARGWIRYCRLISLWWNSEGLAFHHRPHRDSRQMTGWQAGPASRSPFLPRIDRRMKSAGRRTSRRSVPPLRRACSPPVSAAVPTSSTVSALSPPRMQTPDCKNPLALSGEGMQAWPAGDVVDPGRNRVAARHGKRRFEP